MDMDWCLTCDRHLNTTSPAPYCSPLCKPIAGPSRYQEEEEDDEEEVYHQIYYTGNDYSGIEAWAHNVVPGAPEQPHCAPTRSRATSSASSINAPSTSSRSSSQSPRTTTTLKPPSLLSARRPLAPALSFTPTRRLAPTKPSLPLNTTALPSHSSSRPHSVAYSSSTGQDSSALATPASGNVGFLDHVLSWVAPSAPHSPIESSKPIMLPSKPIPAAYNRGRKSGRAVA